MRVLEFSGGKDSLACLLLLKGQLDSITVVWCNSGDAFPETLAQMEKIKAMCPRFIEVMGRQPEVIESAGYPVDVLPVRCYPTVSYLSGLNRPKLQAFLSCCMESLLVPMHQVVLELGATEIIRGQKLCDAHKSPLRDGDVVDGVKYSFPIENWTDEQVLELVKESGLLPEHYAEANTSLDCMRCTAYLAENQWKLPYLERHHPEVAREVRGRLETIAAEVKQDMAPLNDILGGP